MNLFNKKSIFFVAVAAVFFGILLIIFRDFVFNPSELMLNSDQLNGIGSRILRAQNAILTEWDDSRLGGVPTIDALFADAYHPLVWVQFIMDPARAVGFKFMLTIWVAFMSAMALGWHLTGNRWWGALLGFLYALSPEFFTYLYGGHDGKMMVFAIAPLSILAIRKIVRSGSIPYMIIFALSVAWMVLGSHLQLTYLFLWGAGLYALYEIAFKCDALKTRSKRLGLLVLSLGFGLLLSCFQLVPPYMYTTTQSVRGDDSHTNYGHAVSWSLHQEEMAQILLPGFVGVDVYEQNEKTGDLEGSSFVNVSMNEYRQMQGGSPFYWGHNSFKLDHNNAGALLTFLGFLCLFLPNKRRYATFWGVGAVLALSFAMGDHSPLFKLWYNILPGVKNFRAPGMALFWLPLLLVMMASPVLKSVSESFANVKRFILHGTAMYCILLALALIARFYWNTFISPVGLVVMILYAIVCLGVMSLDDCNKKLNVENFVWAFKSKLPGTSRVLQAFIFLGFAYLGVMLSSAQKLLESPVTAPYFKPLNELVMQAMVSKVVPGFIVAIAVIIVSVFVFIKQSSTLSKATMLAVIASVDLFFINSAFIQNVPASDYLQPNNAIVAAVKAPFKADSLNTPRILSLSRNKALSGNIFTQYGLRNAEGIHDNELASYRAFRGGQSDENYLLNINDKNAAHPFLDLMNVGAIIFDTRQGTTYMPIYTAMGEAYLYSDFAVMSDDSAIATLKARAKIREIAKDSLDSLNSINSTNVARNENLNAFYYREKAILSDRPSFKASANVNGRVKLVSAPKMDTQIFDVNTDKAAIMVVAGNYHPYWHAYVNGAKVKVYKAFGALRAVEVPAGHSQVRLEYRSTPLHASLKVSFIAALVLVIVVITYIIRKLATNNKS